eukprot:5203522-Pyramimonas_sp.AAC.1
MSVFSQWRKGASVALRACLHQPALPLSLLWRDEARVSGRVAAIIGGDRNATPYRPTLLAQYSSTPSSTPICHHTSRLTLRDNWSPLDGARETRGILHTQQHSRRHYSMPPKHNPYVNLYDMDMTDKQRHGAHPRVYL